MSDSPTAALPADTAHRPWPVPDRPWLVAMRWNELALLHWPVEPERLRPLVPDALELDLKDGRAWIGVTPFHMSEVRGRFLPPLPGIAAFPELNVRTYVRAGDRPGIWFFSLDAANELAVTGARFLYGLPYHLAEMEVGTGGEGVDYRSERRTAGQTPIRFRASYRPDGPVARAAPGSLEHWLSERYCLYALRRRGLLRADIHHAPWPLQPAVVAVEENTMARPLGIELAEAPPVAHYARALDVVAWSPEPVREPAA